MTGRNGETLDFDKYPIGMILKLIPHHSCSAAAMHRTVKIVNDKEEVVDEWKACRGWSL